MLCADDCKAVVRRAIVETFMGLWQLVETGKLRRRRLRPTVSSGPAHSRRHPCMRESGNVALEINLSAQAGPSRHFAPLPLSFNSEGSPLNRFLVRTRRCPPRVGFIAGTGAPAQNQWTAAAKPQSMAPAGSAHLRPTKDEFARLFRRKPE